MTPQDIIDDARGILSDTDSTGYRYSNTDLLQYVNDGLKEMVTLSPTLFSTTGDYACIAGYCEQAITFADAVAILEVHCIKDSTAVTPFDWDTMNAFKPGWRTDTAAAAQQWCKFGNDPLKFYIYPKAPAAQSLTVRYVRNPTTYAAGDTINDVPVVYLAALVDYVVYRAEARDEEHTTSGRSQQFFQSFVAKVKG